ATPLLSATAVLSAQHRKPQPSLTRGLLRLTLCAVLSRSHRFRYQQLVNTSNFLFIAKARKDKFSI
ncbi:hypothetical protein, partial [Lysinibacillus sphaericus]|uniref:hypothetical protein n=1 Tax=Lysinibacillus sphaericus TaxID=1421 RepID=UPI001C3FEFE0